MSFLILTVIAVVNGILKDIHVYIHMDEDKKTHEELQEF